MYKYTYDTEAMTLTTAVYKASLPSNVEEYIKAYLEAGEKSYAYEIANYKYLIAVANGDTTATAPEAYTPSFPETDNYTLVNCTEYKNATIPFYEKLISIHEKQIKALNDLKTTTKDETILGKIKSSIKSAETSLEYSKRSVNEVALLFSNSSTDLYSFEEDGKLTLTKQFSGALKDQTYSFSFSGDNCYLYVGPYPSMVIYSTGSNFSLSNLKIADGIITGNNLSATYTTEGTGNDTVVTLTITDLPEGYEDYKKTYTLKLNSTSQVYVPVTE